MAGYAEAGWLEHEPPAHGITTQYVLVTESGTAGGALVPLQQWQAEYQQIDETRQQSEWLAETEQVMAAMAKVAQASALSLQEMSDALTKAIIFGEAVHEHEPRRLDLSELGLRWIELE